MQIKIPNLALALLSVLLISACNDDSKDKANADKSSADKTTGKVDAKTSKSMLTNAKSMSVDQKVSYTLGIDIGMRIKLSRKQNPGLKKLDTDHFVFGLKDALGKEPENFKLSREDMSKVMIAYRNQIVQKQKEIMQQVQKDGKAYLEKKKSEKGIITDKSGILYKIAAKGTGKSPTDKDTVKVHYRGKFINGKEFDSSYRSGKPAVLNLQRMIPAWKIMIPKMKEGAKWEIYVPYDKAYGVRGAPPRIRPYETLVFNIELIKVNPKPEKAAAPKPAPAEKKTDKK